MKLLLTEKEGGMTLELSLLSGVILIILVVSLYAGLLVRDQFVLNQCCRMGVDCYARQGLSESGGAEEASVFAERMMQVCQDAMLNTRLKACFVQENSERVELVCEAVFLLPFTQMMSYFGGEEKLSFQCRQSVPSLTYGRFP